MAGLVVLSVVIMWSGLDVPWPVALGHHTKQSSVRDAPDLAAGVQHLICRHRCVSISTAVETSVIPAATSLGSALRS
jgi:hypothetical protein